MQTPAVVLGHFFFFFLILTFLAQDRIFVRFEGKKQRRKEKWSNDDVNDEDDEDDDDDDDEVEANDLVTNICVKDEQAAFKFSIYVCFASLDS